VPQQDVLCPFSNRPCRDCSLYRGRHYALCYSESYRGYMGQAGGGAAITHRAPFDPGSTRPMVIPAIRVRHPLELFPSAALPSPRQER